VSPKSDLNPGALRFCPLCGASLLRQVVPPDGRAHPVCPGCDFVYYLHPKLVAGTLPARDGRVLLTRRAIEPSRGLWTFPGGYVDWGEDVREGVQPQPDAAEVLDVAYFAPDEIPWAELAFPSTREALRDWIDGRPGPVL